jgi:hypothetical protein
MNVSSRIFGMTRKERRRFKQMLENRIISEDLILEHDAKIELPDNLIVDGDFFIALDSALTSLPENLHVKGSFDLAGTRITELPKGLTVDGWIDISCTNILRLPEDLNVGALYAQNSQLTSIPDNCKIKGFADLQNTPIEKLPKNFTVGEWLALTGTPLTRLPDGISIGGLDLRGTSIKEIPENARITDIMLRADNLLTDYPVRIQLPEDAHMLGRNTSEKTQIEDKIVEKLYGKEVVGTIYKNDRGGIYIRNDDGSYGNENIPEIRADAEDGLPLIYSYTFGEEDWDYADTKNTYHYDVAVYQVGDDEFLKIKTTNETVTEYEGMGKYAYVCGTRQEEPIVQKKLIGTNYVLDQIGPDGEAETYSAKVTWHVDEADFRAKASEKYKYFMSDVNIIPSEKEQLSEKSTSNLPEGGLEKEYFEVAMALIAAGEKWGHIASDGPVEYVPAPEEALSPAPERSEDDEIER